jgi:hypothetical protein
MARTPDRVHGPNVSKARGRIAREIAPRGTHAGVAARPSTFDPVEILVEQARGRLQELLPLRYERMAADEFGFLRGAAAVMAADLAAGPSTDLLVQLCGDAHLANFGVFLSPERRLVFDVNDFDETLPGPFEWDVKRLAASIAVAGATINLSTSQIERAVTDSVAQYRTEMRSFASARTLEVWYSHLDLESALSSMSHALVDEDARRVEDVLVSVKRKGSRSAYDKLVATKGGQPRIVAHPPLIVPVADLGPDESGGDIYEFLVSVLRGYEASLSDSRRHLLHQFAPIDAARKVVGVGSVGMRCFAVLLLGRDSRDPFFLQVKEATASVLEAHLGPSKFASHGQRVVVGQELVQATPDPLLGWLDPSDSTGVTRSFYVRQLYDGKASADLTTFDAGLLRGYGGLCGWTLARAHARSGDRFAIASYLGKSSAFEDAVTTFALMYAQRNREDHEALLAAIAAGKVPTSTP